MSAFVPSSGGPLTRWARFASVRYKQVVAAWAVFIVVIAGVAGTVGGEFVDVFTVPNTESQNAVDLLQQRFPSQSGDSATVAFQAPTGMADPAIRQQVEAFLAAATTLPEVVSVTSPYEDTSTISADGTISYSTIQYTLPGNEVDKASVEKLIDLSEATTSATLLVEPGGRVIEAKELPESGATELLGIGVAIVILLITFGSVIAMGMPIITAFVGVGTAITLSIIGAAFLDLSTVSELFIMMIGLGVGIDYSLFIVTRFREARSHGLSVQNAVVTAVDTAGRAVIFAGTIVIIALLGLFIVGIPFVGWMGATGALVVFTSVIAANGLLPAILAWVGPRMDKWTVPTVQPATVEHSFGNRLTRTIQKRPAWWLAGAAAIVLVVAAPMTDAHIGAADAGNNPESMSSRRAYDLLADGFGAGFNGPLLVVVNQDGGIAQTTLDGLSQTMSETENVVSVSAPTINETADTAIITVIPNTAPQDVETEDLIKALRDDVVPATLDGTGARAYIGGGTATFVDVAEKIGSGLPIYILLVAGLSVLILMTVFRSIFIPLKAALLNLLSFSAAYGVLVAVFQWGWGASLIGIDRTGPIESFLPLILFGILFGLSMDYEVFLVSRIRESYLERKDTNWALSHGIGQTGRVILAAGAIMTAVFAFFALGDSRTIKEFGVGLAAAIFIDVVFVRMIIVPAAMTLAGNWNWYFPAWLDRILPRIDIEGPDAHHLEEEATKRPTSTTPVTNPA